MSDLLPLLLIALIALIAGIIIWFGGSNVAKQYLPYSLRRWISMDGFYEGYLRTAPKKKDKKKEK